MEKLGFHYNLTAKTLRTQKSNDIGLILPNITNPYYPEVARGVEDAAQKQGFSTFCAIRTEVRIRKEVT